MMPLPIGGAAALLPLALLVPVVVSACALLGFLAAAHVA